MLISNLKLALLLSLFILGESISFAQKEDEIKPNLIIILTDDQGYADVGFNGATDIPTPNLDRLASQGINFTNGYVSHPYCSPSRAGLLTGRYQARFGHDNNISDDALDDATVGVPLSETIISEALKENGYTTSAIGKWHLGDHPNLYPTNQGFDHWFGFPGGGMNYWGNSSGEIRTVYRNGEKVPESELRYLTDDFTDEAIHFINNNQEQPFFIYLAYNAPHAPDQVTEKYLERTKHIEYGGRSVYAAMVNAVDEGIGKIDSTLVANNLKENTVLVFLSDNGGRIKHANNSPYRGHKGMLFEGGIKVPFFITWPAKLPADETYDKPISSLDIFPTFLEASNTSISTEPKLHGTSLLPYILKKDSSAPHQKLFWRSSGGFEYAIRRGDHKLYKSSYKDDTLLFNLKEDPYEKKNIAKNHPDLVQDLVREYKKWDSKNIKPGWTDAHPENVIKEEERFKAIRKRAMQGQN